MQIYEATNQRQAQPHADVPAASLCAFEFFKNAFMIFWCNSYTGISDMEDNIRTLAPR